MKPIPYGVSSYKSIREKDSYYVDKTQYIPKIEAAGDFLFLIRPRRFGKSSLLTMLECYYDIARAEEFEALFAGTYIHDHPTPEKNAHLILKFNFSQVSSEIEQVEASFNAHVRNCLFFFGKKYRSWLDDDYFEMIDTYENVHHKLEFALKYIGYKGLKLYVLIDEYDNFTNTILSTAGQGHYHNLTHGAGFFRFFFSVLKGAVDEVDVGISRMFITGVSPVTMDDVTSGFNIGRNISLLPSFNEVLGLREQNVIEMLEYYRDNGCTLPNLNETLALMKVWYGNYRFSKSVEIEQFNTDLVLYFLKNIMELGTIPEEMIDPNVKVDYEKLRHLVVLDRKLNGNYSRLRSIIETGGISANIAASFPVEDLTKPKNFISLLYYFGLLSYQCEEELIIPNRTMQNLMYGYLRDGYEDVDVFSIDLWQFANLVRNMAYKGEWQPVFQFLAQEVEKQTSIRDFLSGEKVVQTFLLTYLNVTDYYITHTEAEMGKGFVDLYLEPFVAKYDKVKYAYLIELKYITRSEFTKELLQDKIKEAKNQLQQYASDPQVIKGNRGRNLKLVMLIFSGWELVHSEIVPIIQPKPAI
ncbi:hypothetical protein PN36_24255 [Candidatus Thiomargarita nelsonii]|uniref:AAA-ATPase-like domain-containing protein n=1 Tax=Candidatus Thiomargarita nelsonii TaxID=1003181 RepID=A0A4E0QNA1_9GAMM|nr:hypothetical protein PN36_24255 [Candidatus Thiomargarita nelsonii]